MITATPSATTQVSARRQVDLGRVLMLFLFGVTAWANVARIAALLRADDGLAVRQLIDALTSVLSLAFCLLVLRAYLRRGPARATDRDPLVWFAAPAGTLFPLALTAIPPHPGGALRTAAGLALTVLGLAFTVWSVRALATNLSVVPQARAVVTSGPYRLVRHPLYLGELIAIAGMALHVGRAWALMAYLVEVALQLYRAHREEQLLARELDGYADYAARTRKVIPGIW
jgi:protein-S-isoprenylcysteine O-methyltransferase Ste14